MIDFYNSELVRYKNSIAIENQPASLDKAEKYVAKFINNDATKIAWTVNIRKDFARQISHKFNSITTYSLYRPFTKANIYYDRSWNERTLQMPKIFPENGVCNVTFFIPGNSGSSPFLGVVEVKQHKGYTVSRF